ncbi:hypothetical protein HK18_00505 [Commensalibacter intestini]|uniref:Uncharacterized protein n=1 Tax=Commensalibacter intestini TaxID=479936 RepID=A0A251ZT90_9PROT|nr:molecular chaperone TorD family protein [Commensalibacter intestini]OUI77876.1 hypothetical protein HK18_00505 [Commensalibacter intestini]
MYPEAFVHAAIIDWFSRLFIAPLDIKTLKEYRTPAFTEFLTDLGETLNEPNLTTQIINTFNATPNKEIEPQLAHQYVSLFDGISGPNAVPPYESFYMNDHGRLFQEPHIEMTHTLSKLDVSIVHSCKEPADHLALELAALAEALRQQNLIFIDALSLRLSQWIPQMNTAINRVAKNSFYTIILKLLILYLSSFNHLVAQDKKTIKP